MNYKLNLSDIKMNVSYVAEIRYCEISGQCEAIPHSHRFCELVYAESGTLWIESQSYSGALGAGNVIILRPNETHSVTIGDCNCAGVVIVGFECDNCELAPLSLSPKTLNSAQEVTLAEVIKETKGIYETIYGSSGEKVVQRRSNIPFGSEQMVKINLEKLLISLVRSQKFDMQSHSKDTDSVENIRHVHDYISENFTTRITLDNLCFLFGVNKTTLCQSFKREFGKTVLEYINALRIAEAKKLLDNTKFSITEISERVGFDSIHYFCRFFKKHVGVSPKTYSKSEK